MSCARCLHWPARQYQAGIWVWDGFTWTEQAPATSPQARIDAAIAYDGATGNVVLSGGQHVSQLLDDTWTWGS